MHNLILVERHLPSSFFWPNLLKDKRIAEMSVEEILNKYQGFEGELIACFSVYEDESEFNHVFNRCLEIKKSNNYLMLHTLSGGQEMPAFLKPQTMLLGYDVGVCEEEKTIYSSIFNEILFGHLNELINYKNLLNEHLLFSNQLLAEKYVNLHDELSKQGKGVEDYEQMIIYQMWKQL
jgi:hypothetical protein